MEIKLIHKNARSALIEISDGGIYYTNKEYEVYVNNKQYCKTNTVITGLFGLNPDKQYTISINDETLLFQTDYEFVTLDVRKFGAKGDGKQDDTVFIQAAIMSCPLQSRVLIPPGEYKITNIFLKTGCSIELSKGAKITADNERYVHPILPGMTESYDEKDEYNIGTWEGNPLPMFAGIITGIDVTDAEIYGEGTISGNAGYDNWWREPKVMRGAWRPRLLFLSRCKRINIFGLTFCDSPSWNIHTYFSDDINITKLFIKNPTDSPNTDGIDVESCQNVKITGTHMSLGDDCIALKSGKIYMAQKYNTPTKNVTIYQCLMEKGHGAVTIGSEMAAGVIDILILDCLFKETDRGLRIKTRRGRGELAIVDGIVFRNIKMSGVLTPFVINSFYFCDPDGKSEYVQCRAPLPIDYRTPYIKRLVFENIICDDASIAAAYFAGLPEQKIEEITMTNITVRFKENAKKGAADMLCNAHEFCKGGIFALNVASLILSDIRIEDVNGEMFILENVDRLTMPHKTKRSYIRGYIYEKFI